MVARTRPPLRDSDFPMPPNPIQQDMARLKAMLHETVTPHLPGATSGLQILNLACGRCDEAETLVSLGKEITNGGDVRMVGADIRIREIRQAREAHSRLPAECLIQDAARLDEHKQLGGEFDVVFLRHQNFWHGQDLWKNIFEQGRAKLGKNGVLVITSYFDVEHRLALAALKAMGMEVVSNKRNKASRALKDAPGKSVDRWVAVLRPRK